MKPHFAATEIKDWSALQPGDRVTAAAELPHWTSGSIEETAPELGVLWIREARSGERKLLNVGNHKIWRLPAELL